MNENLVIDSIIDLVILYENIEKKVYKMKNYFVCLNLIMEYCLFCYLYYEIYGKIQFLDTYAKL